METKPENCKSNASYDDTGDVTTDDWFWNKEHELHTAKYSCNHLAISQIYLEHRLLKHA